MASEKKETPTKRRIRKRKIGKKRNNTTPELELLLEQQQQKLLELIRSKAIHDIATANDGKNESPKQQMKAVNAGYRFLSSFGCEGNEIGKSWNEMGKQTWRRLSNWRA